MNKSNTLGVSDDIKEEVLKLVYQLGYLDSAISLYQKYEKTEQFNDNLAALDFHIKIQSKQAHVKSVLHKTPILMQQYINGYIESIINEINLGSSFNQSLNDDDIYPSFVGFTLEQHDHIEKLLFEKIDFQSMEEQAAFA